MIGPVGFKQEIECARHEFTNYCFEGYGLLIAEMTGDLLFVAMPAVRRVMRGAGLPQFDGSFAPA